jgi:osmotically-inducible protein OsmY
MQKQKVAWALATALIVPNLFAGCAVEKKCGFEGCPGDAQITAKVESLFNQHPEIGTEVSVQTLNRVVYLSGLVSEGDMRATAGDLAVATPGVTRVVNTIAVAK